MLKKHFSHEALSEIIDSHINERTARGADGVTFEVFMRDKEKTIEIINRKILSQTYKFTPYKEKLILKGHSSLPRRISIPTLRDRVVLRSLNNLLIEAFPSRKPPHAHPIVSNVISSYREITNSDAVIKLDIKSFYDNINHKKLISIIRKEIGSEISNLVESAIKTPTGVKASSEILNELGVPQGLSISNILSSIYLESIDSKYNQLGVRYHRYVDDILIITDSAQADSIAKDVSKKLSSTKNLKTHALGSGKSQILRSNDSVDYLGYRFKADTSKSPANILISVREGSVKKMMTSVMKIIQGITRENEARAMWRLNIRISGCKINNQNVGWMYYFSQLNDRILLNRMDTQVRKRLEEKGLSHLVDKCKKFTKSHREIKYNYSTTDYPFNFDAMNREQMIQNITLLRPSESGRIEGKSDDDLGRIFFAIMYREVKEMERDTLGSFS